MIIPAIPTQQARGTAAQPGFPSPYEPRHLRFLRPVKLGDWRLKLYGISLRGRAPRTALVDAMLKLAPSVYPRPAVSDDRYGAGLMIAHDAATASIALFYWWQSVNELHQRVYAGPLENPDALVKLADPGAGCVYELGILDFERRAWLEDVLANPGGPDIERYLTRQLNVDL